MRIGLFHPSFANPGGAELLCVSQAQWLRAAGDELRIVTFDYDAARWQQRLHDIEVRRIPKYVWSDLFRSPSRMARMQRRGRRAETAFVDLDVVLAHNFPCSAMLGDARVPVRKVWQCNEPPRGVHLRMANPVLTARVDSGVDAQDVCTSQWRLTLQEVDRRRATATVARLDIERVRALDHLFAISEFSRDNARRIYGRCAQEVIHPIVRFPSGGWSRSGLSRNMLGVLVHSRLETVKNIDTVVRGFATFRASHPGARLHVVGEGAARQSLELLARQLLPEPGFKFHGFLVEAELRRVYDACDVFALLPLDEPFGMVFPEAAAKGLLLIGPDHGGPREILDDGRIGWCVDAFSPEALASALSEAASLSDSQADRRRSESDRSCRARYAEAVIGPRLRRAIASGHD